MKQKLLAFLLLGVLALSSAYAQVNRTITGKVVGADDGLPLPGVSVKVKGSNQGAMTGAEGLYSVNVPAGATTLQFSFLGYSTQEVKIGTSNSYDVRLLSDATQLSEVVVTAYGTQTKQSQTGAVTTVSSKQLEGLPFTSVDKALQGKVAGLQSVASSGQPGSVQNIRIRGIGSISASSSPLYVIDGVPVNSGDLSRNTTTSNALAGINPNDIESISVLKDASASSIYGSRAANGVIIINTKKGKSGKTSFKFDTEVGVNQLGYLNEANRPMSTDEYRQVTAEGFINAGFDPDMTSALADVDASFGTGNGVSTDWLDEVTRTGKQAQYNLAASGGNDKTQFYFSGGYFNQEGTVLASYFDRISGNINVKHQASDKLSFGANMMISDAKQRGPSSGGGFANPVLNAFFLLPNYSPYNAQGTANITAPDFPAGGLYNPIAIATLDKNQNSTLKGVGTINGAYKILPNLKLSSKFGIDYNNLEENSYNNPFHGDGRNDGGRAFQYYTRYFNWVATNLLDYKWDILKNNDLVANITAGYEAQKSKGYFLSVRNDNLPANTEINYAAAGSTPKTASGNASDYSFASILALGDVSYKGRYVLSGSFRRDGSSRFGRNKQYGNFWSVGGSWNVDQEDFIKNIAVINQLKLRASYGVNGNAGIGNYDWRPLYGYGYNYNNQPGSAPSTVGNENLTWETNRPLDLGLDISVLQNRLNLTVEYYDRKTSSLLLNKPLSRTSGFSSFVDNVGAMVNKGFEFSVSGTPVIAGDFKWDASFNFATNKNEITSLVNDQDQISGSFIRRVGEDIQSFYLREWAGVNPANGDPLWYTDATHANTSNVYATSGRDIVGSASPKQFGSLGSTLTFKGISLDGLLYYNFGNYIQDTWARYTQGDGFGGSFNKVKSQLNRWQKPGDITNTPRPVYGGNKNASEASTRFLYKGDYIRLRDVTLGYNLPKSLLSRIKVDNANIYVRGANIWTWTKDKNLPYDPETGVASQTNLEVFIPKTYTVGIKLGL